MHSSRHPVPTKIPFGILASLLAAGVLALFAYAQPAHACLCASVSPSQGWEHADAVFAGEVSSMTIHPKSQVILSSADLVTVEFKVSEVWKGPQSEVLTVRTEWSGISCGYEFEEGGRYIVYAQNGRTGLCTRTAPTWLAVVDLALLGEGWLPGEPPEQPEGTAPTGRYRGTGCSPMASADAGALDGAFLVLLGIVAGLVVRRLP